MREQDSRKYPVSEDMRLQDAFWAWERATWTVLAIILLIALTDKASLTLGPAFAENFQIADIEPRPLRSSAGTRDLEFVFQAPAGGELSVVIWAHPRSFGRFDLTAAAGPEGRVAFSILVYP